MSDKMLKFVNTDKEMPEKRGAGDRVTDFDEIYNEFDVASAETQASRCSQCGVPFCQINCPLHNNIPDWLMLTAEGRMEEAYKLSSQTNNMPEICGRICPQDRLCEGSCVIEKGFESVTIGAVEKHITETAFENGWVQPPQPVADDGAAAAHREGRRGDVGADLDFCGAQWICEAEVFRGERQEAPRQASIAQREGHFARHRADDGLRRLR